LLRNIHKARCFLWRQNNPEVNYSPTRISEGGGVSRGGIAQQEKGQFFWDLLEVGGGEDWMELAQDSNRWRGTCEYSNEPSGFIKCGEFLD